MVPITVTILNQYLIHTVVHTCVCAQLTVAVRNNAMFHLLPVRTSFDSTARVADDLALQEGLMS